MEADVIRANGVKADYQTTVQAAWGHADHGELWGLEVWAVQHREVTANRNFIAERKMRNYHFSSEHRREMEPKGRSTPVLWFRSLGNRKRKNYYTTEPVGCWLPPWKVIGPNPAPH